MAAQYLSTPWLYFTVPPKPAVYGNRSTVAQEIQATIAGRRYQKRHSTANHVITAEVAEVVSRPVLPPSKTFSSTVRPTASPSRPPLLPVLHQANGTMKLRNPLKPLTPPADNSPAPKPIVPVKPVVTPRKPPGKRRLHFYYRPQLSRGKVIFSQASVILSRGGVCSRGGVWFKGVCLVGGVSDPGGCLISGGCLLPGWCLLLGGVCSGGCLLPGGEYLVLGGAWCILVRFIFGV